MSAHGLGIAALVWGLFTIPISIPTVLNYRGKAERLHWGGDGPPGPPIHPVLARVFASLYLVSGLFALGFAIYRFAQGGY